MLIHSSEEVKWTVIRLERNGGEVPTHLHNQVWECFVPLQGRAVIETKTEDGKEDDFDMEHGSFLSVGPRSSSSQEHECFR